VNVALGEPPTGTCAGFRVVDFSTMISGPFCTMFLGDLGADGTGTIV
jgi:crotonobetainyl-CoA:carnitine CoA-transferase CaiB-like acyl-CoA transferase